jgi:cytochrome P450
MIRQSSPVLRHTHCHAAYQHLSTRAYASATATSGCPFGGSPTSEQTPATSCAAAGAVAAKASETKLAIVPTLPYLGSLVPQYSNTPKLEPNSCYDFFPEIRRRYGNFYRLGIPGLGKGRDGIMYVLTDPSEMQKILRQERSGQPYPRGLIEAEWPVVNWWKESGSSLGIGTDASEDRDGFAGRGETWKRLRTFLQTDLLSPQAAAGYVPRIVEAAQLASRGAPASASELNAYTNRCSFDLFCSLMFGELTKMADPETGHSEENVEFCNASVRGMEAMIAQAISPLELVMFKLGFKTKLYKEMAGSFSKAREISKKKYKAFRKRSDEHDLTEMEKQSYLGRAIARQAEEGSKISESELGELIDLGLIAAIDTTSSLLSWNIMHLAMNQDVQDKLRTELVETVAKNGGLNSQALKKSSSPYLHAVIRESHRLTPAGLLAFMKENSLSEVEIHGTVVPMGSLFCMDAFSVGMDPEFVLDPKDFRPERWLPDAVESRKGTPSEIIDHGFYKDPFSQGSRKCPGSRVASNEVLIMVSQLILDWKISAPSRFKNVDDVDYMLTGTIQPKLPKLEFTSR